MPICNSCIFTTSGFPIKVVCWLQRSRFDHQSRLFGIGVFLGRAGVNTVGQQFGLRALSRR